MKSFDDLDENIERYYEGSLDGSTSDEMEIKAALNKMYLIDGTENNIQLNVDISSIVEKGQEVRLNRKIRKATWRFLIIAILMSSITVFLCMKISMYVIMTVQFAIQIVLLILNSILLKNKVRSEDKCQK